MKHHRLFWFLSLLICVSLACTLGQITGSEGVLPVEIDGLSISPTHGSGDFTATVNFSQHDVRDDMVTCLVDNTNDVKTFMLSPNDNMKSAGFPVPVTAPGNHSLECKAQKSGSAKAVTFTVDSGSQPPAPSGDQPQEPSVETDIKGTGTVTDVTEGCSEPATSVLLKIAADNSWAWLNVGFIYNQINCVPDPSTIQNITFTGTVDPATNTANFTSCTLPYDQITAHGKVTYANGTLSGELTCKWSDDWKITMP